MAGALTRSRTVSRPPAAAPRPEEPAMRHTVRLLATLTALTTLASPAGAQQPAQLAACRAPARAPAEPERRSAYVPMPDGVRLAVDYFLPQGLAAGTRLPAILVSTRYWRATVGAGTGPVERFWVSRGYALAVADVRGTGASFGQWFYPWAPREVEDLGHLVDWIAAQPWSDGQVGSIGTSYTGNTAQLVGVTGRPAVRAVVPRFMDFDVYADLTYPGGVENRFLIGEWGRMVHAMDMNAVPGAPGVRPVDADADGALLAAAVRDHHGNPPLHESLTGIAFRDDSVPGFGGATNDMSGTYRYREAAERAAVPLFGWASWLDAGTAQGLVNRFLNWRVPQVAVIGPWSHGGGHHTSPFLPAGHPTDPPAAAQSEQAACFFDQHMRGGAPGLTPPLLVYYTLGEEAWKATDAWPVAGTRMQRWYLAEGNTLSTGAPAAATGRDPYDVDFEVTTGTRNRWYTQLGGSDVVYDERSAMGARMLTYTSPPLTEDVEVTGHPVVALYVTSTATDGNFFVYLEDVAPDGRVTYVTEGMLRALHRQLSNDPPPYRTVYPYRSFLRKDALPLVPGRVASLTFPLLPTSVLFRRGHRIRIAIAGADRDTFARLPADGPVTIEVGRNRVEPSFIELPVVPRD
jgi:uncharacterized protein